MSDKLSKCKVLSVFLFLLLLPLSVQALLIEVPLPEGITPDDCVLMTADTKRLLDQAAEDFLQEDSPIE